MAKVSIKVRDNGPYLVTGEVDLVDVNGKRFETKDQFALCRCGASAKKPFCDGTHKKIGFEDQSRAE